MALTVQQYDGAYPQTTASAAELIVAIDNKLLSRDEARLIYFSQFPVLMRKKHAEEQAVGFNVPALD